MKTLRTLIRVNTALLALLGYLTTTYTFSVAIMRPGGVFRLAQEQALVILLGTSVGVLAVALFLVNDFALIGRRRMLGTVLATGNLLIAMAFVAPWQLGWTGSMGWIPALIPLILAIALAWASWPSLGPEDATTKLAALQIPDDIRQALLRQIGEAAAQEERNRLARDLHDSIKQQLFTINVSTAAAQEMWERDPEKARGALVDVRRSAKEAMVEMQALLHQLTPRALTTAGLVEAIREQCEALGYRTGAEVLLELGEGIPDDRLPPGAQETLFRIAQEAFSNVARHARARHVRVWLNQEGEFAMLRVADNGQGFQLGQEPTGMGLRNLRERAESLRGNLAVTSSPGTGTVIEVRIPLNPLTLPETPIEKAIKNARSSLFSVGFAAVNFTLGSLHYTFNVGWVLLLLCPLVISKRIPIAPGTPQESISLLRFELLRTRALSFLLAAWWAPWYWRLQEEGWTNGRYAWLAVAVVSLLLFLLEMGRFHRASRFGAPRLIVSSSWFRVTLYLTLGVILIGSFGITLMHVLDSGFLPSFIRTFQKSLHPVEIRILFLAMAVPVFLYVMTRQPRTEGAPA